MKDIDVQKGLAQEVGNIVGNIARGVTPLLELGYARDVDSALKQLARHYTPPGISDKAHLISLILADNPQLAYMFLTEGFSTLATMMNQFIEDTLVEMAGVVYRTYHAPEKV